MIKKLLKIDKKIAIIILAFLFAYLIGLLPEHFASDTYFFQIEGFDANASVYLSAGRLIMVLFLKVMKFLSLNFYLVKIVSFFIALLSLFLSIIIMKKIIDKFLKKGIFNTIISLLIVINIFIIELFIFPEYTGVMCFSILCSIAASYQFINYLVDNQKFRLGLSLLFMLLSMLSYQGSVSLFICISSVFLIKYFNSIKSFIKYNVLMGFIYGLPAIFTFLLTRIYGNSRTSISDNNLGLSFYNILKGLKNLLASSSNVMPRYVFLTIILLLITLILTNLIKNKKWTTMLSFIYVLFMCVFFTILPQFMVSTDIIWIVARSNIAIGSLIGLLILFYCLYCKDNPITLRAIYIILIIVFLLQYMGWQRITRDHYIINALDKNYANTIIEKIKEYELKNNKAIKFINYYNDKGVSYIYSGTSPYGDINTRVFAIDWARQYVVDYYAGINYKSNNKSEEYNRYCATNDWNSYDDKQLKFNDETLDICIY